MIQCILSQTSNRFADRNTVFKLFQATVFTFLSSAIITGIKLYFGSPIDCIYDGILEQQKDFVDSYCWKNYEPIIPHFSVLSVPYATSNADRKSIQVFKQTSFEKSRANYYRWLPLILLLQAILTYIPIWLWDTWKDRRIQENLSSIKEAQKHPTRRKLLILTLTQDLVADTVQKRYVKPFFLCEILNVTFLGLNVLFTNLLFRNRFMMYGMNEIGMRFNSTLMSSSEKNMASDIFPQFGKCSIEVAKESGIKKEDAVCMITFNSMCENIFMFFWVWFVILIIVCVWGLFYRIHIVLSQSTRKKVLLNAVDKSFDNNIDQICSKLGFYSWFALYRISRNVDSLTFQDIISSLLIALDTEIYKPIKTKQKPETRLPVLKFPDLSTVVVV